MTKENKPDIYSERIIEREISNSVEIGNVRVSSSSDSIKAVSDIARSLFDHVNKHKKSGASYT